jgi:hypothetical protein
MQLRPVLVSAVVVALAGPAAADVLSMRAEAHGGLVGVEFLFVDVWVQHHQYNDGAFIGTWTQFMTGLDVNLDVGGGEPVPGKKGEVTKPKGFVELGLGVGFGVGTDRQVDPPLDNSEVNDKGFLAEAHISGGAYLGSALSLGVTLPVTAGYYFMSDQGTANNLGTHYQAVEAALLVNLRLKLKIK